MPFNDLLSFMEILIFPRSLELPNSGSHGSLNPSGPRLTWSFYTNPRPLPNFLHGGNFQVLGFNLSIFSKNSIAWFPFQHFIDHISSSPYRLGVVCLHWSFLNLSKKSTLSRKECTQDEIFKIRITWSTGQSCSLRHTVPRKSLWFFNHICLIVPALSDLTS